MTNGTYNAQLYTTESVTLDANGNGIVVLGPTGLGNVWAPIQVAVFTSTNVITPTGYLYTGPNVPAYVAKGEIGSVTSPFLQIGGTATANNDSIGFVSNLAVSYGEALVFQWSGGDAGAQATMSVTGSQTATYFR
jgi:hypothetical protein